MGTKESQAQSLLIQTYLWKFDAHLHITDSGMVILGDITGTLWHAVPVRYEETMSRKLWQIVLAAIIMYIQLMRIHEVHET